MKLRNIIIASLAVLTLASCEDMIVRKSLVQPSADTFFTNATEISGGVNACYAQVNLFVGGYGDFVYSWDGLTETVWLRGNSASDEVLGGAMDFTHNYPNTVWKNAYVGIGRCNLMISKMTGDADLGMTERELNQYLGEVYFLRGYYYMNLVANFGDVPYTDVPVNTVDEALDIPRSPAAQVWQNVYSDFDKAANYLKGSSVKTLGRATWGAAMAYKARAALYSGDYATAKATAKAIMDSGEYQLYPQYETLFSEDVMRSADNKEMIFAWDYDLNANRTHQLLLFGESRAGGGWCTVVPTEHLLDSYECTDGKYIDESPLFNKATRFDNRDPRLHYSCYVPGDILHDLYYDTHMDSVQVWDYSAKAYVTNKDSYSFTQYCSFTGYLPRKYMEAEKYGKSNNKCQNPFYLCRYAEVILTYAEACIETNDLEEGRRAINLIRQRPDVNMPEVTASTQAELRKAVRHERKIELAMESLRLNDIRRWKSSEKVLNAPKLGRPFKGAWTDWPDVTFDENGDPVYNYNSYVPHPSSDYRIILNQKFNPARDYLWPIPQREQLLNEKLTQNPGYSSVN